MTVAIPYPSKDYGSQPKPVQQRTKLPRRRRGETTQGCCSKQRTYAEGPARPPRCSGRACVMQPKPCCAASQIIIAAFAFDHGDWQAAPSLLLSSPSDPLPRQGQAVPGAVRCGTSGTRGRRRALLRRARLRGCACACAEEGGGRPSAVRRMCALPPRDKPSRVRPRLRLGYVDGRACVACLPHLSRRARVKCPWCWEPNQPGIR